MGNGGWTAIIEGIGPELVAVRKGPVGNTGKAMGRRFGRITMNAITYGAEQSQWATAMAPNHPLEEVVVKVSSSRFETNSLRAAGNLSFQCV